MTEEFEIKLQKFADAELSPEEEANVLLDCELVPSRWKDLALAFVAERRLTEALAGFDDGNVVSTVLPASNVSAGSVWASTLRNLAISLAVLMAFVIGRQQRPVAVDQPEQAVAASHDSVDHSAVDDSAVGDSAVANSAVANSAVANSAVGSRPSLDILNADSANGTFVNAAADSSDWQSHTVSPWTVVSKPVITEEDRGVFSDAGFDVEEQNTVYIVSDPDGGRWAIPWKAVNIRYSAGP
ncbi:MAG: hypothetical protein ABJZ55_09775 [Fuerstiella sp.]